MDVFERAVDRIQDPECLLSNRSLMRRIPQFKSNITNPPCIPVLTVFPHLLPPRGAAVCALHDVSALDAHMMNKRGWVGNITFTFVVKLVFLRIKSFE